MANRTKQKSIWSKELRACPAVKYAKAVVAKRRVAGPYVRMACQRFLDDLQRSDIWYDLEAAAWAAGFFPDVLTLSDGQFDGKPFVLDDHQEFIIRNIFGFKRCGETDDPNDKTTWRRRFRRVYLEIGKGNGKSPLLAGVGIFGMVADKEQGAQIYAAGATKDQSRIVFDDAIKMRDNSEDLTERIKQNGKNPIWQLRDPLTGSIFRPLSKETKKTGSGWRPHMALIDELHEHPDRGILEMLERGFKFRRQPLLMIATNSGHDRQSVCYEEHEHGVRVVKGDVQDDSTFVYICANDEKDKPLTNSRVWKKTNPMLGKILEKSYLKDVTTQAKSMPGRRNNILRLNFCTWTNSSSAWMSHETWIKCIDKRLKESRYAGKRWWGGIDLSCTKDMTAFVRFYEDGLDRKGRQKYAGFCDAYMPLDNIVKRCEEDRADYKLWADQGYITLCPGAKVRFEFIAKDVLHAAKFANCVMVAYDKYLYDEFEDELDSEYGIPTTEHPQGYNKRKDTPLWMPQSITEFETFIIEGRIRFGFNPALNSAIAGATFEESPTLLRKFTKSKATTRIDLTVAGAMAAGATLAPADNPFEEFYSEKGAAQAGAV